MPRSRFCKAETTSSTFTPLTASVCAGWHLSSLIVIFGAPATRVSKQLSPCGGQKEVHQLIAHCSSSFIDKKPALSVRKNNQCQAPARPIPQESLLLIAVSVSLVIREKIRPAMLVTEPGAIQVAASMFAEIIMTDVVKVLTIKKIPSLGQHNNIHHHFQHRSLRCHSPATVLVQNKTNYCHFLTLCCPCPAT